MWGEMRTWDKMRVDDAEIIRAKRSVCLFNGKKRVGSVNKPRDMPPLTWISCWHHRVIFNEQMAGPAASRRRVVNDDDPPPSTALSFTEYDAETEAASQCPGCRAAFMVSQPSAVQQNALQSSL